MKHKKTIMSVAFLLLGLGGLHAQESVNGSGGEATGTGGTTSYSLGQVVYTTATGSNGSVAQGVQQPYEISIITGINATSINLEMNVFPNPTTNYITLKIENEEVESLTYQLIDLKGKLIEDKKIIEIQTSISMETLPKAIYFLKVEKNNKVVKTFKVIKN
tara:strand:- start:652 stop:1134 length:483 start_codon:yes stop_codon:yes gene_type:complete